MLIESLEKLGAQKSSATQRAKLAKLAKLERAAGPLPENYRELILYFGGDIEFSALMIYTPRVRSPWTSKEGTDMLDSFYGLTSCYESRSILDVREMYLGRIPASWLPIGSAPGGNQICLAISGDNTGVIAFWDHESEVMPEYPQTRSGLSEVARSLEEFVSMLTVDNSPAPDLDAVKVDLRF